MLSFRQRDFRSLVGARLRLTLVKRSSQYGSVYHRLGAAACDSDFAASSRAAEKRRRAKASLVQREVGRRPGGIVFFILPFSTSLAHRRRRAFSVTFVRPKVTKGHRGLCAGPRSPTAAAVCCDADLTEVSGSDTAQPEPPFSTGRWVRRTRRDCWVEAAFLAGQPSNGFFTLRPVAYLPILCPRRGNVK